MGQDVSLFSNVSEKHFDAPKDLTHRSWRSIIDTLKTIGAGHQYWIGDALNFGETEYGEKYAQAVDPAQAETWRHYAYVCRKVPPKVRNHLKSFSHSKIMTSVPNERSMLALAKRCEDHDWTVDELRQVIRGKYAEAVVRVALPKESRIKSRKLLDQSSGQACIRCESQDGTIVSAHYSGTYATRLGGGMGTKVHDFCVADLCEKCHKYFDSYKDGNDDERSAEFFVLILLTIHRRWEDGVLGMMK